MGKAALGAEGARPPGRLGVRRESAAFKQLSLALPAILLDSREIAPIFSLMNMESGISSGAAGGPAAARLRQQP
jgi:hypothetical protein